MKTTYRRGSDFLADAKAELADVLDQCLPYPHNRWGIGEGRLRGGRFVTDADLLSVPFESSIMRPRRPPEGMEFIIRQYCETKFCANPNHWCFEGEYDPDFWETVLALTTREEADDSKQRREAGVERTRSVNQRFDQAQVDEMRSDYANGTSTQGDLARKFGTSIPTIGNILHNRTYFDPDYSYVAQPKKGFINLARRALTPSQVKLIRSRYAAGTGDTQPDLAKEFDVSVPTISRIIHGETYREVES